MTNLPFHFSDQHTRHVTGTHRERFVATPGLGIDRVGDHGTNSVGSQAHFLGVLDGWYPRAIALRPQRRTMYNRPLSARAKTVNPEEQHLWQVKMEDNWRDERAS